MKTPLNLCFTAKKKKDRKKNLNRLYKNWILSFKRYHGISLNDTESKIFEVYADKIWKELESRDF